MNRCYNFSAGPAILPESVLEKAAKELVCYPDAKMSVMEMSHRSKAYEEIIQEAEQSIRELMQIPQNYKVLFLQGGASSQFSMVPLNLFSEDNKKADYVITGQWSKKASQEASRYGEVNAVASSADKTFSYIPQLDSSKFNPTAAYFHITTNNTIYGTCFPNVPETGNVPLVADMSSDILSKPYDVSKFGVIYAGAQKNMGPAGVTVVIIREDLIKEPLAETPTMFNYGIHASNNSLYNTPPTYSIYMCGLVYKWVKALGGLSAMETINKEKVNILYDFLDNSKMFSSTVKGADRSIMNIPFVTGNEELDAKFVKEAAAQGLVNLKGHRSVGGMRASIYNAMPKAGVVALVDFMKEFEVCNS